MEDADVWDLGGTGEYEAGNRQGKGTGQTRGHSPKPGRDTSPAHMSLSQSMVPMPPATCSFFQFLFNHVPPPQDLCTGNWLSSSCVQLLFIFRNSAKAGLSAPLHKEYVVLDDSVLRGILVL